MRKCFAFVSRWTYEKMSKSRLCIHIPPKREKYWEINSPQPRDFLRPESLRKISMVEKNLEGRSNGFPNTSWYLVDYIHSVIITQNRSMWPKNYFDVFWKRLRIWKYHHLGTRLYQHKKELLGGKALPAKRFSFSVSLSPSLSLFWLPCDLAWKITVTKRFFMKLSVLWQSEIMGHCYHLSRLKLNSSDVP